MAKTAKQMIFSIREQASSFVNSDDFRLDNEWILQEMLDARASLILDIDKSKIPLPGGLYQTICCLEIKCRTRTCNNVTLPGFMEYYIEMPKLIEGLKHNNNILFFGGADLRTPWNMVTMNQWISLGGNEYTFMVPTGVIVGEEILITNLPTVPAKYVCMVAIPANPINTCSYSETDDFVPEMMESKLEIIVLQKIKSNLYVPPDDKNNSADDTAKGVKVK